jgi:hypothetical protein
MAMYETLEAPMPAGSVKTLSNKTMWGFLKKSFRPMIQKSMYYPLLTCNFFVALSI